MSSDRQTIRMAWLAGLGDEIERYRDIAREVDNLGEITIDDRVRLRSGWE
jgi:hypothetical protein